jgi:hypothetical protein
MADARQVQTITLSTVEQGKVVMKMYDRINVDDVYLHLVNRELYRIISGEDTGVEVDPLFKDFLLKERFTTGQ